MGLQKREYLHLEIEQPSYESKRALRKIEL